MYNVLYKADKCDAAEEDRSDAEAEDDDQGQGAARHGCGGTSHHTVQTSSRQELPERPLKTFRKEDEKLTGCERRLSAAVAVTSAVIEVTSHTDPV